MPFPEKIKVTIELELDVADQAERDYWLDPTTNETTLYIMADLMDAAEQTTFASINGKTPEQIRAAVAAKV